MDIGAADNDEQREATYRFLNDEISAQYRSLMEEARGLDTKATVVAGFATAAVSFLLANRRETVWWFALAGRCGERRQLQDPQAPEASAALHGADGCTPAGHEGQRAPHRPGRHRRRRPQARLIPLVLHHSWRPTFPLSPLLGLGLKDSLA